MMRYFFNRGGAIVCGRDTLEECLDYAKRTMGWDIHFGRHVSQDEFGGSHSTTYKVEEHELLPTMTWKRTYNDTVLDLSQATFPFTSPIGATA